MKVCVIGLGYIGLPTAAMLALEKYKVVGVDINKKVSMQYTMARIIVLSLSLKRY